MSYLSFMMYYIFSKVLHFTFKFKSIGNRTERSETFSKQCSCCLLHILQSEDTVRYSRGSEEDGDILYFCAPPIQHVSEEANKAKRLQKSVVHFW